MAHRVALAFASLVLAACSDGILVTGSGGSRGAGTTSVTATSSTSGAGGAFGAGGALGAGGFGGAGAGPACGGAIDVVVDGSAPEHLAAPCAFDPPCAANVTGAFGYIESACPGGCPCIGILHVVGCAAPAAGSAGLVLQVNAATAPGVYTQGSALYIGEGDAGTTMGSDPFEVTVTKLGMVGDSIEGTFAATTTAGNVTHAIQGSFHVCHAYDQFIP